MRLLSLFVIIAVEVYAQTPSHPLDGLTTVEYWTVYDALQQAGHVTPTTLFASVLLHPPAKSAVLSYRPGQPFARHADVVLLRGEKTFAARVDIVGKKALSFEELPGVQAPILASELFGNDEAIKSDPRVVEALKKRGITNLGTVSCIVLPGAYPSIPEQATQRMGFGSCSERHGVYHSWGRAIEGLTLQVNMATKKLLKVVDTEVVPVPTGNIDYEGIPENPRPIRHPSLFPNLLAMASKSRTVRSPGRTGSSASASISALVQSSTSCASSTTVGPARFFMKLASASYSSPTWIRRTGGTIASS